MATGLSFEYVNAREARCSVDKAKLQKAMENENEDGTEEEEMEDEESASFIVRLTKKTLTCAASQAPKV